MVSAHYIENDLIHSFHIVQTGLGKDMASIDFVFTMSKVKVTINSHFRKKMFSLIVSRSIYHRASIFHVQIGLSKDMTTEQEMQKFPLS